VIPFHLSLMVYGADGIKFIDILGERLKVATGDLRSAFFLKQTISRAIQRGNSAAIFGTLPTGKGFGEIFNL